MTFCNGINAYDQVWPYLIFAQAMSASVGIPCGSAALSASPEPVLGSAFTLALTGGIPNANAAVYIDPGEPVPASTLPNSCPWYLDLDALLMDTVALDAQGAFSIQVPVAPGVWPGTRFRLQALPFDAVTYESTNALSLWYGHP